MGTECFNGKNNDIDIKITSFREKKVNYPQKSNNLEYHPKSQRNEYKPIHYQSHFQEHSYTVYQKPQNYYSTENVKKTLLNKSRSNSLKLINNGKQKKIYNFTNEELEDQVNDILRIRIPFFENSILKTLSAFTFLSGNGPYHEGLMFFTTNKNFYIAQSYPITFVKVYDFYKGISEIVSFNNINKQAKKYVISEIYCPQEPITLHNVLNIINTLPNKYNLLNDNCQDFCNNILNILNKNFKIEKEIKPNATKINFLKMQKKTYNVPNYKPYSNSGRFNNL